MKKYVIAKSLDGSNKIVKIKSIKSIKEVHPVAVDEFGHRLKIELPSYCSQVFEVEVENGDKLEVGDEIEHPENGKSCHVSEVHEEDHGTWIEVVVF